MDSLDPEAEFKQQLVALIPTLRAFARSLCGDLELADDIVQESILKAWSARDRFKLGTNMKAWTHAILRNHYYSYLRAHRRELNHTSVALDAHLATEADQIDKLFAKDLGRLLMSLPEHQREAIILVGAGGFSYKEAAEICGCSIGTIKSRVNRGRERLANQVDEQSNSDLCRPRIEVSMKSDRNGNSRESA